MTTPTEPGYYRCVVYASRRRGRGVHQVVVVTDRPRLVDGFPVALDRVILQVGTDEPLDPDMVVGWGGRVDVFRPEDD